jgi:hypothetical protein
MFFVGSFLVRIVFRLVFFLLRLTTSYVIRKHLFGIKRGGVMTGSVSPHHHHNFYILLQSIFYLFSG